MTKASETKSGKKQRGEFDFIPVKSSQTLARRMSDGSVAIIRLDSDQHFFTLAGISAEVWDSIDGKKSMNQIVNSFIEERNLPESRFVKDVKKLVFDLRKQNLIESRPASTSDLPQGSLRRLLQKTFWK